MHGSLLHKAGEPYFFVTNRIFSRINSDDKLWTREVRHETDGVGRLGD